MILKVGNCLQMIAGEFDLSAGFMIGFAGTIMTITSVHYGWPMQLSIVFTFACALVLGWVNRFIVTRTDCPPLS